MWRHLLVRRVAAALAVLLGLTALLFLLENVTPVDPVHAMLGPGASQQAVAAERHQLGLDEPAVVRYFRYLGQLLHGDLGVSWRTRRPVSSDLASFVPATAELTVCALAIALVLALLLAVGTTLEWPGARLFRMVLLAGASTPPFLLALGTILVFYRVLNWLPAAGRSDFVQASTGPTGLLMVDGLLTGHPEVTLDALRHLVLPALAVAVGPAVAVGRVLRSSLMSGMQADYARTARAKGLREREVLARHVLRNAIGPALSMTGLQLGLMFAGVVVVEQVFSWPGLGQYVAESIPVGDFPAIAGVTLLMGVVYVGINTLVDVLQAAADPRIRA